MLVNFYFKLITMRILINGFLCKNKKKRLYLEEKNRLLLLLFVSKTANVL